MSQTDLSRRCAEKWTDQLRLPAEITRGDLAVTLKSAALDGVSRVETYPLNHVKLPRDPRVIRATLAVLMADDDSE